MRCCHLSESLRCLTLYQLPADLLEFLTDFGLTQPGAQVALKLYVVLTTGNEAGSPAMLVLRP